VFLFELGWSIELNLKKETLVPCFPFWTEYYVIGVQRVERSLKNPSVRGLQIGHIKTAAIKLFDNLESHGNFHSFVMLDFPISRNSSTQISLLGQTWWS
jgi:hypothetical protein